MIREGECDEEEFTIFNNILNKRVDQNKNENKSDKISKTLDEKTVAMSGNDDDNNANNDNDDNDNDDDDDDDRFGDGGLSRDAFVLYTICDSKSTLEVEPRRGIFDGFQESEVQDPDSFMWWSSFGRFQFSNNRFSLSLEFSCIS